MRGAQGIPKMDVVGLTDACAFCRALCRAAMMRSEILAPLSRERLALSSQTPADIAKRIVAKLAYGRLVKRRGRPWVDAAG